MKVRKWLMISLAVAASFELGAQHTLVKDVAREHLVIQKDRAFSVTELTIKPGESIVFKNADDVPHNVFSNSPNMQFDIRRQAPGGSSTVPFPREGVAEVRCAIHPKMKLIVTVKK